MSDLQSELELALPPDLGFAEPRDGDSGDVALTNTSVSAILKVLESYPLDPDI